MVTIPLIARYFSNTPQPLRLKKFRQLYSSLACLTLCKLFSVVVVRPLMSPIPDKVAEGVRASWSTITGNHADELLDPAVLNGTIAELRKGFD